MLPVDSTATLARSNNCSGQWTNGRPFSSPGLGAGASRTALSTAAVAETAVSVAGVACAHPTTMLFVPWLRTVSLGEVHSTRFIDEVGSIDIFAKPVWPARQILYQ